MANKTRYKAACKRSDGVKSHSRTASLLTKASTKAKADTHPEILPTVT